MKYQVNEVRLNTLPLSKAQREDMSTASYLCFNAHYTTDGSKGYMSLTADMSVIMGETCKDLVNKYSNLNSVHAEIKQLLPIRMQEHKAWKANKDFMVTWCNWNMPLLVTEAEACKSQSQVASLVATILTFLAGTLGRMELRLRGLDAEYMASLEPKQEEEEQPLKRDDVHQGQEWDTHKIVTTMCEGYVVNITTLQARNLLSLSSRMINKGDTSADWRIVASQALNLA